MDSWIGVPNKDAESRRAPFDGGAVEGSESLKRHEGFPNLSKTPALLFFLSIDPHSLVTRNLPKCLSKSRQQSLPSAASCSN
jgi:hypothetical protein